MGLKQSLMTALIALAAGFAGAGMWSMAGLDDGRTQSYLMDNPQILPAMAEAYQQQESQDRLAQVADGAEAAFPGAVLGNPNGSVTLVEFTDYGCTYCRSSLADVRTLIAENPDLKVVVREWPIFDGSEAAARMALAAAKQGRFAAFHYAMFEMGPPSDSSIERAALAAGMDLDQAMADANSSEITNEVTRNREMARTIGFTGTPSWIAAGQVLEGAVGADRLGDALENGTQS